MSQRSDKTAQGKGKQICSKVSSTASKFQKNRANWKIHPGQYTTNLETINMAIENSSLVDGPVKTVSKISLWVSTSFENKQAEQTAPSEKIGQIEKLIPDSREGHAE